MKPIVCYSASSQRNWRERLKNAVDSFNLGVQNHFCMVSTNATFSIDYVQDLVSRLSGNVVLVIDEAHNFGAENLSCCLLPHIPYRLAALCLPLIGTTIQKEQPSFMITLGTSVSNIR